MQFCYLPEAIEQITQNKPYTVTKVGLSGAEVRLYDELVLKIQPHTEQSANEATFMRYLQGKNLAPDLVAYATRDNLDYILMSRLKGDMLCSDRFLSNPRLLLEQAREVFYSLWQLPIQDCPCNMTLKRKLSLAQSNVLNNRVDLNNVNPELLGVDGRFKTPELLLKWLIDNKPNEDLTVTHGDFCLPNVFVCGNKAGIIDFPYGGVADRYCDIALFYRSLKSNLNGEYGGKVYGELDDKLFFDALAIKPDFAKIDYYILLDELF